jgi:hypothetical protein
VSFANFSDRRIVALLRNWYLRKLAYHGGCLMAALDESGCNSHIQGQLRELIRQAESEIRNASDPSMPR